MRSFSNELSLFSHSDIKPPSLFFLALYETFTFLRPVEKPSKHKCDTKRFYFVSLAVHFPQESSLWAFNQNSGEIVFSDELEKFSKTVNWKKTKSISHNVTKTRTVRLVNQPQYFTTVTRAIKPTPGSLTTCWWRLFQTFFGARTMLTFSSYCFS